MGSFKSKKDQPPTPQEEEKFHDQTGAGYIKEGASMNQLIDTLGELPLEVHIKEEERMWIYVAENYNQTQELKAQAQWWVGAETRYEDEQQWSRGNQ